MNKTLNINLAGLIFHIDENAFNQLEKYLETLKKQFRNTEGGNEIVSDIEARLAELFKARNSESKQVINEEDVLEVIKIMGRPEDYLDPEDDTQTQNDFDTPFISTSKRIFRDPDNRVLGGVSSGVAAYFNIDPLWIRLLFVLLVVTAGTGVLIYIIMWIVIPKARTTADKLRMRGEPVNVSSIQKSIKEEMEGMGKNAKTFGQQASQFGRRNTGIGGFFSELFRFIGQAIRLIMKFILKIIGVFLLAIAFVILFSIIMGLIMGTVDISGQQVSIQYLFEFLKLITLDLSHYNMLIVSIVLSVIAPLFLITYLGIRILFNLDPLNKPTRSGLAVITLVGLVMLAVSGARVAQQFSQDSAVSNNLGLPESQQYYLTIMEDSIYNLYEDRGNFDMSWLSLRNQNAFNRIDINVKPTDEALPFLMVRKESQGPSRRVARANAEMLRYEISLKDSVIAVPAYYLLEKGQRFRAQEIDLVLYLPAGYSVYLDESLDDYIYDIDNIQNMWDPHMLGLLWHMTEDGLTCDSCEIPGEEDQDVLTPIDSLNEETGAPQLEDVDSLNTENGGIVIHSEVLAPAVLVEVDDHSFLSHISQPIQNRVKSTTLNILRNHYNFRI